MILIVILSFIAAFIFALGGIGAAIILIPIMVLLGIPITTAKPVGLFFNTVSLTGATVTNIKNKTLDYKAGLPIIVFSFVFAAAGAYLSKFISTNLVLYLFVAFLLFSGLMFLFFKGVKRDTYREDTPYISLSLIGVVAGLLSGLLGIGGGGIISPLMLLLGFNPKKIAAITAFVVPFSSFSGFLTYWSMGSVDWKLLIWVSLAGFAGATLGTLFMQKKLNPETVKKILAFILLAMAVKMVLSIL